MESGKDKNPEAGDQKQVGVIIHQIPDFHSNMLGRGVCVDLYLPEGYETERRGKVYPFMLFNDGQDLERARLKPCLESLWSTGQLPPIIAVGIHAGAERIQEYGTAGQPDYKGRGSKAAAYTEFISRELLPWLRTHYPVSWLPDRAGMAGFSLGGLSALDIVWKLDGAFTKVGVFSGSLWWRSQVSQPDAPDAHRIMHEIIAREPKRKGKSFWFQAGTKDETADRNSNGIIDVIDDTLDLIGELEKTGYIRHRDIRYLEIQDGEHTPETWAEAMPDFLKWAFGDRILK